MVTRIMRMKKGTALIMPDNTVPETFGYLKVIIMM